MEYGTAIGGVKKVAHTAMIAAAIVSLSGVACNQQRPPSDTTSGSSGGIQERNMPNPATPVSPPNR